MKLSLLVLGLALSTAVFAMPLASGKISMPSKLVDSAKGIRTIFISVYDAAHHGTGPSMPYGAVKIDLTSDAKMGEIAPFLLDTDTMMLMTAQEKMPAKVDIKVKLDKDGSAGPDSSGDIIGWAKGVKAGTKGLIVKLDKQIP